MSHTIKDIVVFRKDKLFNGAVDIEWFYSDRNKSLLASKNYVFHGPDSHAVHQNEIHSSHKLVDTASFTLNLLKKSYGLGEAAFSMVIAGYGSGKSHLALTLSHLLHDKAGDDIEAILNALELADPEQATEARKVMATNTRPALVVPINGMGSFDLTGELTKRICSLLVKDGHSIAPIDNLRPRFRNAAKIVEFSTGNAELIGELIEETGKTDVTAILEALTLQDEGVYKAVHRTLARHGFSLESSGAESIKKLLDETVRIYCGDGKPYRSIVILFDEFGKYMEFSTTKPHLAGEGSLQSLFEGIQAHGDLISFVGFIQYELHSYAQRLTPAQQNEFKRYGTRFESAEKSYLSTNIETLIANLFERKDESECARLFHMDDNAITQTQRTIRSRFPHSASAAAWSDDRLFRSVIVNRCWPLSPYAMWFIYYLSAAGKFLQERSALNLLDEAFSALSNRPSDSIPPQGLPPVALWSASLKAELLSAEESGLQGNAITSYTAIEDKYEGKLTPAETTVLRAIVIASKTSMVATSQQDAVLGITLLGGLPLADTEDALNSLRHEYNVIEWDEAAKGFELVGDSAPRKQFLRVLQQKTAELYDSQARANLFSTRGQEFCSILSDIDTSFGEQNHISTPEWKFASTTASLQDLPAKLSYEAMKWCEISQDSTSVKVPKGRIFYVYVDEGYDIEEQKTLIRKQMSSLAKEHGEKFLPMLCVLLNDEEGILGHALAELEVMANFSAEDKAVYGNLISAHKEKRLKEILSISKGYIRQRQYVSLLKETDKIRLNDVCLEIFKSIYAKPIPFPMDGFNTARGNAGITCATFMRHLLCGSMNQHYMQTATVIEKIRSSDIFRDAWETMDKHGIALYPKFKLLKAIFKDWDARLNEAPLSLSDAFKELVRPPYGANFASAQLVIGTFIAGRHEKLIVTVSGKGMSPADWSESVFSTKAISYPVWDDTTISLVGDTPDEWKTIMGEWLAAQTFSEICHCCDQAEELNERLPVPTTLFKEFYEKKNESAEAKKKLNEYDFRLNKALEKLEIGEKKSSFHNLLSGAAKLRALLNDMEKERTQWTQAEFDRINAEYPPARMIIKDGFSDWVNSMRPISMTLDAVNDFRNKMAEDIKRLKLIDFPELAAEAEKIALQIRRNAEQYAKISQQKSDMLN